MNGCGFVNQQENQKRKRKMIDIFYQNTRGLRTKLEQFYIGILTSDADLFAITETGCYTSIQDAELIPNGYHIVRCDRADGRKQGGALLVATPQYELRRMSLPGDVNIDDCSFELVCAKVFSRSRYLFLCCVVYIPPNSDDRDYMLLFHLIEQLCVNNVNIVVIGDFNLHSCSINVCNYYECFLTFCEFTQNNQVLNCNGRQLDLVLCSFQGENSVCVYAAAEGIVPVDVHHPPLDVSLRLGELILQRPVDAIHNANQKGEFSTLPQWNFNKADFPQLYYNLANIDWSQLYKLNDIDSAVDVFYKLLSTVFNSCVPKKQHKHTNLFKAYPAWYTVELISEINYKNLLHKKYKASKSKEDYDYFSYYRAEVKKHIKLAYQHYINYVQHNLIEDPKSFWKFIKSKKNNCSAQNIIKDGKVLTTEECAREFATYFYSVYGKTRAKLDVNEAVLAARDTNAAARIHLESFQKSDIMNALVKLKPKKSAGPDGIPAFIFKDCRMIICEPLIHIFNLCLRSHHFPECWKITRVIPVPKGKAGADITGYRPIAVLSIAAKVFESALQRGIVLQLGAQLSDSQHGFIAKRSTDSNLLTFMSHITPIIDRGGQVDAAYFDFQKAFDLVDNDVLLSKLSAVGFTPHLLKFFVSYMRDRRQYVDYAGHKSEPYFTYTGVSQGSNLGPLEFLIVINDLPHVVENARCLLFADDLKLYLPVGNVSDADRLQADIDRVVEWSRQNKLRFNTSKCVIISFTRKQSPIQYTYTVDKVSMRRVSEVRDLGVQLKSTLSFREYIIDICKKAFRRLGFILRTASGFSNVKAVTALYNALVRSQLETNSMIWTPFEAKYVLMVERVQKKFLRFLYFKQYGVYPFFPLMYPTLFILGMVGYNELSVRREFALARYMLSILNAKIYNPELLATINFCVPDNYVGRRRRPRLLAVPTARTDLIKKSAMSRTLHTLNVVAEMIDLFSCSLSEFTRLTVYIICYKKK